MTNANNTIKIDIDTKEKQKAFPDMATVKRSSKRVGHRPMHSNLRHRTSLRRPPCRTMKVLLASGFALLFIFVTQRGQSGIHGTDAMSSIDVARCNILTQPNTADVLPKLTEIDLKGCGLKEIPANIQYATNIRKLDVSDNPIVTLPPELAHCTDLDTLFVSSCRLITSLPTVLGNMQSITRLGWRSGSLREIDPDGLPPNLVHLILTNNQITSLDDRRILQKMKHVRKLMLSHNKIRSFGNDGGVEMLKDLELLRLGDNSLHSIPDELWKLPKLTWLTISGNPIVDAFKATATVKVPSIKMSDLKPTGKYLGAGASGKVELYGWEKKEVAVKIIHGVTSDGNAEDELAIYSEIGRAHV